MNRGYDSNHRGSFPDDDEGSDLPRKRRKAIRSLMKLIEQHQQKIADFQRDRPVRPVRPGMEGMDA